MNRKKKLKKLGSNLNSEAKFNEYTQCKSNLEIIYDKIAEGFKITSKYQWYEKGEKSIKFFLNVEKKPQSITALVRKLKVHGK